MRLLVNANSSCAVGLHPCRGSKRGDSALAPSLAFRSSPREFRLAGPHGRDRFISEGSSEGLHRCPEPVRRRPISDPSSSQRHLARRRWDYEALKGLCSDSPQFKFNYQIRPASLDGFGKPEGYTKEELVPLMHHWRETVPGLLSFSPV